MATTIERLFNTELERFAPTLLRTAGGSETIQLGQMTINNTNGYRRPAVSPSFNTNYALAKGPDGCIYMALHTASGTQRILKLQSDGLLWSANYYPSPLGGGANAITSMVVSPDNAYLYFTVNSDYYIRRLTLPFIGSSLTMTTIAGTGSPGSTDHATGTSATFNTPRGLAINAAGTELYVCDYTSNKIRMVTLSGAFPVTTLVNSAGTATETAHATGTSATITGPQSICINPAGTFLYFTTAGNRIRAYNIATTECSILAGQASGDTLDGTGTAAKFAYLSGISIDEAGESLYACQGQWSGSYNGSSIRKIVISSGVVTTVSGMIHYYGYVQDGFGTEGSPDINTGASVYPNGIINFPSASGSGDVFMLANGNGQLVTFDPESGLTRCLVGEENAGGTSYSTEGDWFSMFSPEIHFYVTDTTRTRSKLVASITPNAGGLYHWQGSIPIEPGEKLWAQCCVPGINITGTGIVTV